jgi:glycosyltransferase involved in cell wall biosynthesis
LRLAYIIKEMVMGGSQTHLRQVLRLLDRDLFEPVLFCLTGKGALLDDVRALDVPVIVPAGNASFKGASLPLRIAATARELRRLDIDIVHNYLLRANLVGSVAARLARVPVVLCSKRGCHERRGFELISAKIGNRLADRVMVNADAVRDFVHDNEGCPRDKMFVIPSGVDTERFRPRPEARAEARRRLALPLAAPVVGTVGRLEARKGTAVLLEAAARALKKGLSELRVVVVGDGPLRDELPALAARLGIAERVHMLGDRSDIPEILVALDAFVLPSRTEGMSNALLEAMATALPVVATAVGGNPEVVSAETTGVLVPPDDAMTMADAMTRLIASPTLAAELGAAARRAVEERYGARAMVRRLEDIYEAVADLEPRRRADASVATGGRRGMTDPEVCR